MSERLSVMDAKLLERCDRQIANEKALRNMSDLESEASVKVGSLLYTAIDLPVNDDSVYAARKIMESKDSVFSSFRGVLQSLVLLRMSLSKDPEAYIDTVIDTYKKLNSETGISGLYTVLSAVIITEQHGDKDIDAVISQVIDLFHHIKALHPERTNASELAYVALMYLSGKADVRLEDEKEKIYSALKEKLQLSDEAARATSLVLMTNSESAEVKVDGFVGFYNSLNATGHATGKTQYISVYGAFADLSFLEGLGIPETETIQSICEVDEYLKKKTGYGVFSISKDMRKVLAAALTLQHYTIEIPKKLHSDFQTDVSIELLLFIVLMSLVAIR